MSSSHAYTTLTINRNISFVRFKSFVIIISNSNMNQVIFLYLVGFLLLFRSTEKTENMDTIISISKVLPTRPLRSKGNYTLSFNFNHIPTTCLIESHIWTENTNKSKYH